MNKRTIIIRNFMMLVYEHGLAETSLAKIAQYCMLSKAAMYHYFVSKKILIEQTIAWCIENQEYDYLITLGMQLSTHDYKDTRLLIHDFLIKNLNAGEIGNIVIERLS